jgi:hypothetical protein
VESGRERERERLTRFRVDTAEVGGDVHEAGVESITAADLDKVANPSLLALEQGKSIRGMLQDKKTVVTGMLDK